MTEPPRVPILKGGAAPQTVRIEIAKPGPDAEPAAKDEDGLRAALAENASLKERLTAEAAARGEAELALRRFQRGVDAGLSPKLAARLRGATDEEIDADIADLLPHARSTPAPNPHQGRWAGAPTPSLASGRELYQAKHNRIEGARA